MGYVNISVQGYYIERFINVCISKNIFLWNIKIEKSTYAHANVGIKDFKKLKEVARKTKCRTTLNSKHGIPFFMNRYRKRKIFGIFLALIVALMYTQSRFIWNIQIEGLERIPEEEIISELSSIRTKYWYAKI
ncbi:MAG: sporulation protein YqfD [Clostridia bacterium]|nr:sporulation protein YqfD [Clostridia bacterium]